MRKLLYFALPFALGTALCQYLLPALWQLPAAAAALLSGLLFARLGRPRRPLRALAAAGLAAGIVWFWGYGQLFLAPALERVGSEEQVTLELVDYPQEQDYGARCTVRILGGLPGKAVYYGDVSLLALEPGDRVTTTVKYYAADVLSGEKSTYYTSQGVFARLYDRGGAVVTAGDRPLRYLPLRLNRRVMENVAEIFPADTAPLITALLTGEREGLSEEVRSDLEETGLMHVTAVSGLHCGFLVALVGLLLGNRRRLTALVGYPVLLCYMLMVGCSPSVVRSCVMMGFLLLAPLLGREGDGLTSLAAAALVILLADPFAVASLSFQLSFAAVAGILLLTPGIYRGLGGGRARSSRMVSSVWNFLAMSAGGSFGTMAFTAPLSAVCFGSVPLVAPLANLAVLWVAPVLFAAAFLAAVPGSFLPGCGALAVLADILTRYVQWVAGLLAEVKGHAVYFEHKVFAFWLFLVYAMLIVCLLSRERGRKYMVAALLAVLTLFAARSLPVLEVRSSELTVIAVDVGQGAATLLHSGGVTALVDCGSHYVSGGAGAAVAEVMDTYGWDGLDYLVLTHYHEDHAGGIEQLLTRVEVEHLLLPQLLDSADQGWRQMELLAVAREYAVDTAYVEEETALSLGKASVRIYPPLTRGEINEEGLSVLCSAREYDVLITGDMNSDTEEMLLEAYSLPDIELLLVGHHGSRYSTSATLLDALRPEVGIISVGENSYGHPTEETMLRMTSRGMTLYRTDLQGNVVVRVPDTDKEREGD